MSRSGNGILCALAALAALAIVSTSPAAALAQDAPAPADSAAADSVLKSAPAYLSGPGIRVAQSDRGTLNIRVYSYVRYLDQLGLDPTFTDSFGTTKPVQARQDMQISKAIVYFMGWFMDPKFRYLFYVWTTNTAQGNGAQVVVAGNLTYLFNSHATVGIGINALPGVRSTEGNFPNWLSTDNRLIADSYFMPSYTTGVWSAGDIVDGLRYAVMLGNNLSQLGVDAAQMDNTFDTWSGGISWMPTTHEFGDRNGFGDYDRHEKLATRLAGHYTRSSENKQSQPGTEAIENAQIRISDGNIVFQPGLFGPGINIEDVRYQMMSYDAGLKYHGLSLDGEFYKRWVDNLRGPGTDLLPMDVLTDTGVQGQVSAMVVPKALQLYAGASKIYGQYGDPSDYRFGVNWFPWKTRTARWNAEMFHVNRSPVGALSLAYPVGGNGNVFYTNFEIDF